ncbi:MAG: squalene synthase HpnC [Actinomycetota bacterium]|nr:squalene synthase HpnC [Actinomycetota bacterium]
MARVAPATSGRRSAEPDVPTVSAVMEKAGHENFPVASRLLPRQDREHFLAIYGFARLVDDLGDEAAGDRGRLLDWLEAELERAYAGGATHPLMVRLAKTIRARDLPREPFLHLIRANRQDQSVSRYETYSELASYCELSANPVGHLVLYVLRAATPQRMGLSDAVCTGLQLAEHWQDVAEDFHRGRIYLPREDLERFGCSEEDLARSRPSPSLRRLMAFEVARARGLLDRGAPLAGDLGGRAGFAVAGFVAGGRAALDALEGAGFDVLGRTPRPSRGHGAWVLVRTVAVSWRPAWPRRGSGRRRGLRSRSRSRGDGR